MNVSGYDKTDVISIKGKYDIHPLIKIARSDKGAISSLIFIAMWTLFLLLAFYFGAFDGPWIIIN